MTCGQAASCPTREEIERIRGDYDAYCAAPDYDGAVRVAALLGIVLRRVEWLGVLLVRPAAEAAAWLADECRKKDRANEALREHVRALLRALDQGSRWWGIRFSFSL